jgi:hypothetical protein
MSKRISDHGDLEIYDILLFNDNFNFIILVLQQ